MCVMKKIINFIISNKKIMIIAISILIVIGISLSIILFSSNKKNNSCVISFETNGGDEISKVELECGKKLKQPKTPEKEGFDFKYWIYEGETVDFDSFIINPIMMMRIGTK